MAIFGFGKGREDPASAGQVLAYLEDALRARSPFTLVAGSRTTTALLHSVNEEAGSFRLLPKDDLPLAKGGKLAFTLIHDGLRLGGAAPVLEARTGILVLRLPDALALMERRSAPRARLNAREMASLTALQSLGQGVGITSAVENISEGGCRVRVEKALAIGTEKRLVLGSNLVAPGTSFMVVRLNKVPRCPGLMEAEGKAVYLAAESAGLVMGIAISGLPGPAAGALRALVAQRCPPIPAALPAKARRPPEPREETPAAPAPAPAPEPPAPAPAPAAGQPRPGDPAERRHTPRLSLGEGFQARFMAGDLLVTEADLTDLSAGGCCLRLPLEQVQGLQKGSDLEEFHFLHGDLPRGVLQGRVKWVLGRRPGGEAGPGYGLVGVEFLLVPDAVGQAIAAYVAEHLP
jgi:c-di-GMP-binding flagellar brake protein YcgR